MISTRLVNRNSKDTVTFRIHECLEKLDSGSWLILFINLWLVCLWLHQLTVRAYFVKNKSETHTNTLCNRSFAVQENCFVMYLIFMLAKVFPPFKHIARNHVMHTNLSKIFVFFLLIDYRFWFSAEKFW